MPLYDVRKRLTSTNSACYSNKKARIVQSWKKENNKQNKMNQNKGVNSY